MDDLTYDFLLQSIPPRAAIVMDADMLGSGGSGLDDDASTPTVIIVDPLTAQLLAVLNTINAVDNEIMRVVAIQTRNYAAKLAGKSIQGFVIRVDYQGAN